MASQGKGGFFERARKLEIPTGKIRAIIDSDVANEIDDPFAIAHALLSPDQITVEAITLAPFRREGLTAGDSLELSRGLAEQTLTALSREGLPVVDGSREYLSDLKTPVLSRSVETLLGASENTDDPLHILAIGAATNVASALLVDPSLADRAVVWWLGGHSPELSAWEYNLMGDRFASEVLLQSGIPIVNFPAWGVTSHLFTSLAAMERDLEDASPVGKFLTGLLRDHVSDHFAYEKELWDVAVPAFAIDPSWFKTILEPTPGISADLRWTRDSEAPLWRRVTWCSRNQILGDLFRRFASADD